MPKRRKKEKTEFPHLLEQQNNRIFFLISFQVNQISILHTKIKFGVSMRKSISKQNVSRAFEHVQFLTNQICVFHRCAPKECRLIAVAHKPKKCDDARMKSTSSSSFSFENVNVLLILCKCDH